MRPNFLIAALLVVACSKESVRVTTPKPDDIILITIDTLRADRVGRRRACRDRSTKGWARGASRARIHPASGRWQHPG
jgi:hypothetical protein